MRVAVFVDAGYVYAQGSLLISKSETKKSRDKTHIKANEIVSKLSKFAISVSGKKELLRIYWYDAEPTTGRSEEQKNFAQHNNVKLRLGQLNSAGQQKGVDSLIVVDLTELARNSAITDAVVFTGDEDIRIAVEIAQNHGVRVHLLGISGSSPKGSQSVTLQNEADTVNAWNKTDVASFMTVDDEKPDGSTKSLEGKKPVKAHDVGALLAAAVSDVHSKLKADTIKLTKVSKIIEDGKPIPGDVVKLLYAALKTQLKKEPVKLEKDRARELLKTALLRK